MYQLYDDKKRLGYALTGLIKEIGRSEECDIALADDESVSRVHARLEKDGDEWLLVDLGSTNGTFVNGKRVKEVQLQAGDSVEIGDTRLRFLPLKVADGPVRKKTTNISLRKENLDETRPDPTGGLFSRVKTALKKK